MKNLITICLLFASVTITSGQVSQNGGSSGGNVTFSELKAMTDSNISFNNDVFCSFVSAYELTPHTAVYKKRKTSLPAYFSI